MNIDILYKDLHTISNTIDTMKSKIEKMIEQKQKVILGKKIQLLHESLQNVYYDMDDVVSKMDSGGVWSLSKEDIERLQNNKEAKKIQNIFFPYMLCYKVVSDIINT